MPDKFACRRENLFIIVCEGTSELIMVHFLLGQCIILFLDN